MLFQTNEGHQLVTEGVITPVIRRDYNENWCFVTQTKERKLPTILIEDSLSFHKQKQWLALFATPCDGDLPICRLPTAG